ncbi:MAG TPA: hypothetical protein VNW46_15045 [Gemmatimonadaceae bacterium]|nr:hypothetical protein [Gemmatimonadaceae bacterium]
MAGAGGVRLGVVAALWVGCAASAGAQLVRDSQPGPRAEARIDAIIARRTAIEAGLGGIVPAGIYFRLGGDVAGGVIAGGARPAGPAARADVFGRFLLDPLEEHRWGPYLTAGASYRADSRDHGRVYLLALVGVEGPRQGRVVPAIEAGFGGGFRIGFVLRRAQPTGWR